MAKSVYPPCESWIVAASNQPGKHTASLSTGPQGKSSIFIFVMMTLLSRVIPQLSPSCCYVQSWPESSQVVSSTTNFSLFLVLASLLLWCLVTWQTLASLRQVGRGVGQEGSTHLHSHWLETLCSCFLGTEISCFSPSSFLWSQASFVDSYFLAAIQQKDSLQGDSGNFPSCLHKVTRDIAGLSSLLCRHGKWSSEKMQQSTAACGQPGL